MPRDAGRWAADPAATAACTIGEIDAAPSTKSARTKQVLDPDGHRLSDRRYELTIPDVPRLASPSVWRWAAAERWAP